MPASPIKNNIYKAIILAVLATLIWSGNFVIARGIADRISPVSLAFFRWLTACIVLLPIAYRSVLKERKIVQKNLIYFFWLSLSGITLFNTLVYVAGHYSPAINLALIGTTSAPIMAMIMAALFLKEKITLPKLAGLIVCITGILILLSGADIHRLLAFRFSTGDWWVLAGALCFAIYNTLVKVKPAGISSIVLLFVAFGSGTLLLFPAFIVDSLSGTAINWDYNLVWIILYLGIGTSVISFLCWNISISILGAARTALFGNLIPIFSSIEAVIFLGEKITRVHLASGVLVIAGLIVANLFAQSGNKNHPQPTVPIH